MKMPPHQRPGTSNTTYSVPKWTIAEFDALPDRDKAVHLACPQPALCFAEGGLTPGTRCGPCEAWATDQEAYLVDLARTRKIWRQLVGEYTAMRDQLAREVEREEAKSGISDQSHFAYPVFCKAARNRMKDLGENVACLEANLAVEIDDLPEDRAGEDAA